MDKGIKTMRNILKGLSKGKRFIIQTDGNDRVFVKIYEPTFCSTKFQPVMGLKLGEKGQNWDEIAGELLATLGRV